MAKYKQTWTLDSKSISQTCPTFNVFLYVLAPILENVLRDYRPLFIPHYLAEDSDWFTI